MLLNYGFAVDENPFNAIEIDILELNDAFYNFFRSERPLVRETRIFIWFSVWIKNTLWQNSMPGNTMQMWLTSENTLTQNLKFSMIGFHLKWTIISLTYSLVLLIFFSLTQESERVFMFDDLNCSYYSDPEIACSTFKPLNAFQIISKLRISKTVKFCKTKSKLKWSDTALNDDSLNWKIVRMNSIKRREIWTIARWADRVNLTPWMWKYSTNKLFRLKSCSMGPSDPFFKYIV